MLRDRESQMSSDDEFRRSAQEVRTHFFLPPSGYHFCSAPDETCLRLDAIVDSVLRDYREVAEAFRHSLKSTLSTVAMPVALAHASAQQRHFQKFRAVAAIQALLIEPDAIKPGEDLEAARDREGEESARKEMHEFAKSKEGTDAIALDICRFLLDGIRNGQLESAAKELLQQGTILLWSAFEVLFRDVFEIHMNLNPSKAEVLAQHTSTRKRFGVERFSLDTLVKHGFDLSSQVGTVLVSQHDLADLPTVKTVYTLLFPASGDLLERLNDPDLWLFYQRRHLLVHRRGIVDQTYLDNTSDNVPINAHLPLKPKDFENYYSVVRSAGEALLSCLTVASGHSERAS